MEIPRGVPFFKTKETDEEKRELEKEALQNIVEDAVLARNEEFVADNYSAAQAAEDQEMNNVSQAYILGKDMVINPELGLEEEKKFFRPILNRILALEDQIMAIHTHIVESSGTTDLEAFNGLIMQKKELQQIEQEISSQIQHAEQDPEMMKNPQYQQKVQQFMHARASIDLLIKNIDSLSPAITPEEEQALEEKKELLVKECMELQNYIENTFVKVRGFDAPINFN